MRAAGRSSRCRRWPRGCSLGSCRCTQGRLPALMRTPAARSRACIGMLHAAAGSGHCPELLPVGLSSSYPDVFDTACLGFRSAVLLQRPSLLHSLLAQHARPSDQAGSQAECCLCSGRQRTACLEAADSQQASKEQVILYYIRQGSICRHASATGDSPLGGPHRPIAVKLTLSGMS